MAARGLFLSALLIAGCAADLAPGEDPCAAAIERMAACYPDLAREAHCTDATLEQLEQHGLRGMACEDVQAAGKADLFSFGGCDAGQHECGWLFCCDDYVLTWFPSADSDWDIVGAIAALEARTPASARSKVDLASRAELLQTVSATYQQDVAETVGGPTREMAVELTRGLVALPYTTFRERLAPWDWGVQLSGWLGGEVRVYQTDANGWVTHQLERMVLSPYPLTIETPLTNNDMTKVEVIAYTADSAKVYWRVRHSDNGSTETDIGFVEFRAWDAETTAVTFHSAHRLRALGGLHIPNGLVTLALGMTFEEFVDHYRSLVSASAP